MSWPISLETLSGSPHEFREFNTLGLLL